MCNHYDRVSIDIAKCVTRKYSTSFSIGIHMLHRSLHDAIYAIYGFVRVADEIVDSFHEHDQASLLEKFTHDTFEAIQAGISTNPVLQAFQSTVNSYQIDHELIQTFLDSMHMDLTQQVYDKVDFEKYILGSAEVVGLMCLKVFVEGDHNQYEALKTPAMKLGSAFQKVNFLRDLAADYSNLGRSYFPGINLEKFSELNKSQIEDSIQTDFDEALTGIQKLPKRARLGVIYRLQILFTPILQNKADSSRQNYEEKNQDLK